MLKDVGAVTPVHTRKPTLDIFYTWLLQPSPVIVELLYKPVITVLYFFASGHWWPKGSRLMNSELRLEFVGVADTLQYTSLHVSFDRLKKWHCQCSVHLCCDTTSAFLAKGMNTA